MIGGVQMIILEQNWKISAIYLIGQHLSATTTSVTINGDQGIQVVGSNGSYPEITKNVKYNFDEVHQTYSSGFMCQILIVPY